LEEAQAWNQLGRVAILQQRWDEAEHNYRRSLDILEYSNLPVSYLNGVVLDDLAGLLYRAQEPYDLQTRENLLSEAQRYAERSLGIKDTLGSSSESWPTFDVLAHIADLQGRAQAARDYRRREREDYAAFEANGYRINERWVDLIMLIAAGAQGNDQARAAVENILPAVEEQGWQIANATHRIWAGERDWQALAEGLDRDTALLILRILEIIEEANQARRD
jgi:hypothetical protein